MTLQGSAEGVGELDPAVPISDDHCIGTRNGLQLVGFAATAHGLKLRKAAMASVEESGVVVAVPG